MAQNQEIILPKTPSAPTTGWQAFLAEKSTEWKNSEKRCSMKKNLKAFIRKSQKQWSQLEEDERCHYSTLDTGEQTKRRKSCRERLTDSLNAEIDSTSSMYVVHNCSK